MFPRVLESAAVALTASALALTPAVAAERVPAVHGSATLLSAQGCLVANRAEASVSGTAIASVAFYVDGKRVRTVASPDRRGRFTLTLSCARLRFGTHRARAVVAFEAGIRPARRTIGFQITRSTRPSPRFAS